MRRTTIREMRERELKTLVSFKTDKPKAEDWAEAKRLMNSYYRLCGLSRKNAYLQNDEKTCDSNYAKVNELREMAWHARLNEEFEKTYGLQLVYLAYYPSIGIKEKHGGFHEKVEHYFYE